MTFKVLLIDDEPWALEGLQLLIPWESLGLEVCASCGNGADGIKRMEEINPDLVMVDINMPVMDGLQMIEEWRHRGNWSTKFIILTGYSDFEYARKALKYKVSRYLLKPLDEEQAESEVRAVGQELLKEQEKLHIGQIAEREHTLLTIKEAMIGKELSVEANQLLMSLPRSSETWNVCLVQATGDELARWLSLSEKLLNQWDDAYMIYLRKDLVSIVFSDDVPKATEETIRKQLDGLARRLAGFRAFMAIGAAEHSIIHIRNSLITAEKALLHAFYEKDRNDIISYDAIKHHAFQRLSNQVELQERIMGSFQLIDHAAYRSTVEYIDQYFREMRIHPDHARKFVIYLLHEIQTYMGMQMAKDTSFTNRLFEIPNLDEALLTLEDLIGMLNSCGRVCFQLLLKENAAEALGLVQDINDYIHTHYREGLTIKLLAEHFFLNPAYLGQLLIRKNGIGFNEQLHNLRIEEACRLLQTNQYSNSAISEKVGYTSYPHFLKQFEKRLGMSPNVYKKSLSY